MKTIFSLPWFKATCFSHGRQRVTAVILNTARQRSPQHSGLGVSDDIDGSRRNTKPGAQVPSRW